MKEKPPTTYLANANWGAVQVPAAREAVRRIEEAPTSYLACGADMPQGGARDVDSLRAGVALTVHLAASTYAAPLGPAVNEGTSRESVTELNLLCSFHYFRKTTIKRVAEKFPGIKVRVFADSGGFSAMSLGEKIRLADYVKWLRENEADLAMYANLDAIGDPATTARNQKVLEAEGLRPIPVFHVGSDFKYLDEMIERYSYIALGGMVPYTNRGRQRQLGRWVHDVFVRIAQRSHEVLKVHGFGLGTSWDICKSFPWHSIDASSWTSAFQLRNVSVFDDARGDWADINMSSTDNNVWEHAQLLRSYGFSPSDFYPPDRFSYVKAGALGVMGVLRAERWLRRRREAATAPTAAPPPSTDEAPVPMIRVHGFGIGSWPLIAAFPWASVDSSSLAFASKYRDVFEFDDTGKRAKFKLHLGDEDGLMNARKLADRHGVPLADLRAHGRRGALARGRVSLHEFLRMQEAKRRDMPLFNYYFAASETRSMETLLCRSNTSP